MQQNNNDAPKQDAFPPANIGNASNPAPEDANETGGNQLIDKKGEKYLREVASPEDYPDEADWEEANKIIDKEKGEGQSGTQ